MIPQSDSNRTLSVWLGAMLMVCVAAAVLSFFRMSDSFTEVIFARTPASESVVAVPQDRRPMSTPEKGPGGPILVITSEANHFSSYYAEILRNEGFNEFEVEDISRVTPQTLRAHDLVILGDMPLSAAAARLLHTWVRQGGNLIAMRPDRRLAQLVGVESSGAILKDAYLSIDNRDGPGRGLVKETIQFHGTADLYASSAESGIATLYRDAATPTQSPAVLAKAVGAGQVVFFAYDLARSIVYTRQGNPAWSGMERDGIPPMRTDDLFYGAASYDQQADWVDLNKDSIPQADEQQRLLANLILQMSARKKPLPRFWYFPRGLKAVVIMTGDDHGHGGTIDRFDNFLSLSPANCSFKDWQCVRGTSNIFLGSVSPDQAATAARQGFEIGLHLYTGCEDWPLENVPAANGRTMRRVSWEGASSIYLHQLEAFSSLYPDVPHPVTSRIDCITWGDYDTQPRLELQNGIRLDTNYYYWPAKWVKDRPGVFTGSGLPMRLTTLDGSLIDVYQAATQMTDESGQSYPFTINSLLDRAFGPTEYVGAFTANMHTDQPDSEEADMVVAAAQARGVPIITAAQMLTWLDGRNDSSFQDLEWNASELRFGINRGDGADGLQALLPMSSSNSALTKITVNGSRVDFHPRSFAGLEYAAFPALPGKYVASYSVP